MFWMKVIGCCSVKCKRRAVYFASSESSENKTCFIALVAAIA